MVQRIDDPVHRYYGRKAVRYLAAVVALIGISVVWRAFAGRVGVVLGLFAAGVAFAMQEVIGAVAGWFNIVFGRIFGVGDRIELSTPMSSTSARCGRRSSRSARTPMPTEDRG